MSDIKRPAPPLHDTEPPAPGPNLTLIYTLIGLAMLAAIVIAALVVLPFYNHR